MSRCSLPLLLALLAGCGGTPLPPPATLPAPEPAALEADGLHNLFRVSDRLYSGSSPDGESGFTSLERLGVKTVISVDGSKPDVAIAEKHGLRYVHLPIGYDGIPSERVIQLAKAVRDLPGPVYIHCHHGTHRGPAACAAVQLTLDPRWTAETSERWLSVAGTDPKYRGLVGMPHTLRRPTATELDAIATDFPTVAKVTDLVRVMVEVDERWDHLKAVKTANWKTPKEHPDLDPPHEAVMLTELYREAARLDGATARGKEFVALLGEGESAAHELEAALRAGNTKGATAAFGRSQATCTKCHENYRDRK
jgi:protein tyrosine phosphatase (PTP) superfamily phosphohydrolase (DUF442 family)